MVIGNVVRFSGTPEAAVAGWLVLVFPVIAPLITVPWLQALGAGVGVAAFVFFWISSRTDRPAGRLLVTAPVSLRPAPPIEGRLVTLLGIAASILLLGFVIYEANRGDLQSALPILLIYWAAPMMVIAYAVFRAAAMRAVLSVTWILLGITAFAGFKYFEAERSGGASLVFVPSLVLAWIWAICCLTLRSATDNGENGT